MLRHEVAELRLRFLIRDRAVQFTNASDAVLADAGRGGEDPAAEPSGELLRRTVRTQVRGCFLKCGGCWVRTNYAKTRQACQKSWTTFREG